MNSQLIELIYEKVENACKDKNNAFGYGIWTHHIKPMIPVAQKLAQELGADEEIVTIATLLHDLAGIQNKDNKDEHHVIGSLIAEKILKEYNYRDERIELVKECIKNHRSSVNNQKKTNEEICVADADAIIHMIEISSLFYAAYKELNMTIDDGREWVRQKIERDWKKMSVKSQALYLTTYRTIIEMLI